MRRFLISGAIYFLTVTGTLAQDKTSLGFPLGLSAGISNDSAAVLLITHGANLVSERENIYALDFPFADMPIKTIIPIFLNARLLSVSLYSNLIEDREFHITRIKKAFEYLGEKYDCRIIEEKISSDGFLSELDDGIELASFSSERFSVFIGSEFKPNKGYLLNIHIYSLPLIMPSSKN